MRRGRTRRKRREGGWSVTLWIFRGCHVTSDEG